MCHFTKQSVRPLRVQGGRGLQREVCFPAPRTPTGARIGTNRSPFESSQIQWGHGSNASQGPLFLGAAGVGSDLK